jgi:hypothetical protein
LGIRTNGYQLGGKLVVFESSMHPSFHSVDVTSTSTLEHACGQIIPPTQRKRLLTDAAMNIHERKGVNRLNGGSSARSIIGSLVIVAVVAFLLVPQIAFSVPNHDDVMAPPMTFWGYAYLNGTPLNAKVICAWIDGTRYATTSTDVNGQYMLDVNGDDTPTAYVKEGGYAGDKIFFSYEGASPRLFAVETGTWIIFGLTNLNLNFWTNGTVSPNLVIQGLSYEDNVSTQWVELYNPSANPVDLSGYFLQKDVAGSTNNYNGATKTLSGTLGASSVVTVSTPAYLGTKDEIKLVWKRGSENIPIDRVEYGNQSTVPDNTTMRDARTPPIGWCIQRVPQGQDTDNCFTDFQLIDLRPPVTSEWCNITVTSGWNLISIPLLGPTALPGALSDKADGGTGFVAWTRAMWYNPWTSTDPWKQYNANWSAGLNDLTTVNNTQGVWLYVTAVGDGKICIGGAGYSKPVSTNIGLRTGWNLVGFPSDDTAYTVAMLKAACPIVTTVEQFDGAQTYLTASMADSQNLGQGKAYWILVDADSIWLKTW